MKNVLQTYKVPFLLTAVLLSFYAVFAYDLQRHDFIKLITLYAALFFLSFKIINLLKGDFKALLLLGILFRLVFLFALPNLSQDYFRFLWDGRLLAEGFNPYLMTPDQWIEAGNIPISQATELISGMGSLSAMHYTNYPPVNQFFFMIAGWMSPENIFWGVFVLRLFIILADLGILWIGIRFLWSLKIPEHRIFWYFLNPFIIIELTGNLHFEGVMLFFVLAGLYQLHKSNWFSSAVLMGISVSVKLLPLMFLPLFYQYLIRTIPSRPAIPQRMKNLIKGDIRATIYQLRYFLILGTVVVLIFIPFASAEFLQNFLQTISLWFQKFEFNASVYYLIRWIGFETRGYNIIGSAGKILPLIVIFILFLLSFFRRNTTTPTLMVSLLFGVSVYFLLSTTVHPWYIATPLLFCIFTPYRFPIVWSATVMFSYSAYGIGGVTENLWLVALEYAVVVTYAIWEISTLPRRTRITVNLS